MLFVNVGETRIWESKQKKILGVLIDRDLKFDEYVLSQCKKAGKKLTALIRISKFMTFAQRRNIMKAFIESQFGYCSLVWMFYGRQTNARINHIHERALRAVYNDEISPLRNYQEEISQILSIEEILRDLLQSCSKLKMVFRMISWLNLSVKETA